jgi:hypothetical protein
MDHDDENDSDGLSECEKIDHMKHKYYLTKWIDITYLFDLRLIESNLYI